MALTTEQQSVIRDAAFTRGIPAAFALGIIDKESAGRAFYKVGTTNVPAIRYEGHYLYRLLVDTKDARTAAVKAGFAAKSSGVIKNPGNMASRYTFLDRVVAFLKEQGLNTDLAYQSISIGIGQIMGSHYGKLGYGSAFAMWQAAAASFDGQAEQMLEFIYADKTGLRYAQDFNYKAFGKWYNGPKAPASYWIELEAFVKKYLTGDDVPNYALDRLNKLGFDNIMSFQSARGIKVDGIIGPITLENIVAAEKERALAAPKPAVTATQVVVGSVAAGASTVAAANPEGVSDIVGAIVPIIDPITKGITTLAPLGLPFILVAVGIVLAVVVFNAIKKRTT